MNSKDYAYIVEIARQGSISKAAGRLYITQPALSRFLQRTEEELGTSLFYKVGKQLVPTAAGECYLKHAAAILQQNLIMQEELDQIIHDNTNVIKIGASASRGEFLASWLLPLLQKISRISDEGLFKYKKQPASNAGKSRIGCGFCEYGRRTAGTYLLPHCQRGYGSSGK